jgi:hypothetical protein
MTKSGLFAAMAAVASLSFAAPAVADSRDRDRPRWDNGSRGHAVRHDNRRGDQRADRRHDNRGYGQQAYQQGYRDGVRADNRRNAGQVYRQPNYPVYGQPVYRQPVYRQPVYRQPIYSQPVYSNYPYQNASSRGWVQGQDYWYGNDGRYYCRRGDGTTGLLVGAVAGGTLGNILSGQGDKTLASLIGGALGAVIGSEIDKGNGRCR